MLEKLGRFIDWVWAFPAQIFKWLQDAFDSVIDFIDFYVIRNGRDIGDYVVSFRGKGDDLTVNVATDVSVKVPVIGVSALSNTSTLIELDPALTTRIIAAPPPRSRQARQMRSAPEPPARARSAGPAP